jgi:hypothetical protein
MPARTRARIALRSHSAIRIAIFAISSPTGVDVSIPSLDAQEGAADRDELVDEGASLARGHRVPGQVVVDEEVGELEVAPLSADVRPQHDRHVRAQPLHCLVLLGTAHSTVEARMRDALRVERGGERLERGAKPREDQRPRPAKARVLRTITSPSNSLSRSRLRGENGCPSPRSAT